INPHFDVLITGGPFGRDLEVLCPNATPKCFVVHILELTESCAELRCRHIHQRKHIAVSFVLDTSSLTLIALLQTCLAERVISVQDCQDFMLRTRPLKSDGRAGVATRSGN